MYTRLTFAFATLIGLGGVAQAEILSGGPVFAGIGPLGGTVNCRIFNSGAYPASITSRQIFAGGVAITIDSDTCNVPLLSTKYCVFSASATNNVAYSCRIIIFGVDEKVSGVADILGFQSSGPPLVLNSLPLHR